MANKIDLLKITEPTIVSSDTDVFYIRKIGENADGYDEDEMMIAVINNLNMRRTPINTCVYDGGPKKGSYYDERRPIARNCAVLSSILENDSKLVQDYFKNEAFYDVTESFLAFKFGYLHNIKQVDALWSLAARYGYTPEQDERRMFDHDSLRAFQTTGNKIVFADYLDPAETIGRQQFNFPATEYGDEDIG